MKNRELAKRLAKDTRLTPQAAADLLDRVVTEIIQKLKRGQPAKIPGLGTIRREGTN